VIAYGNPLGGWVLKKRVSRGALKPATDGRVIPASDWLDFYLLSPRTCMLARVGLADFADFITAGSRWARLAGI
jgi:hypothetical protein